MEKLHLYLVRHCESLGNRENIFQGQLDLDISATGEKQLALLTLRFRNIPIDAVYSSPLKRAYKTAEAVDLYHSLPIIKLPELMEVDVGALSGMKLTKRLRIIRYLPKSGRIPRKTAFFRRERRQRKSMTAQKKRLHA